MRGTDCVESVCWSVPPGGGCAPGAEVPAGASPCTAVHSARQVYTPGMLSSELVPMFTTTETTARDRLVGPSSQHEP